jgi:hypothetical protein
MIAEAGPSSAPARKRHTKNGKRAKPGTKKAKKVSEKQRIEQLERDVQDFVSLKVLASA